MGLTRVSLVIVILALLCLCLAPLLVSAHIPTGRPFNITGCVYCDTCRAGFETTATTFIAGAKVRLECRDRESLALTFTLDTVTDASGRYIFIVEDDHEDQICDCLIKKSPLGHCNEADPGRNRASAVLTRNMNGIASNKHNVNNMGFFINKPLVGCNQLLKKYFPTDDQEE